MRSFLVSVVLLSAIGIAYGAGLNVRDFGAKGDGVTDDTAAFNAAGAAMLKQAMSGATIWGFRNRGEPSGSLEEPRPALFVPKGRYLIKGTIVMSRDVYVRGEDGAELVGESPTNDIFYVAAAYRTRIENLSFVGGRHQFRPETFNAESANIRILNCRFRDSAASAVYSLSYKVKGARWGCGAWNYDRKTFEFSPNTNYVPEKLVVNNHSTMFVVDGCRFDGCATAVTMCPDGSVVRNCEFVMTPGDTNAALKVSNEMHGYGLKFVHYAGSAAIETSGGLKLWLENSSVTTPDRSGARVLRGNLRTSGSVASELVMQDVRTDAGLAQGAAICDFHDAFPAYAALVRVTAEGPNEVKAFSFKPQEDFETFDKSRRIRTWEPDRYFSYGLRDCSANIVWRDGYAKRFERPIPDWAAGKVAGCTVDHSTAGERKVFEAKWHEASDTFVIDRDATFDADGVAAFRGMPADKPWFVVKKGARAVLRNLQLRGGRNFVVVESGGEAFVDSCFSYDCEDAAFTCEKGGRLEVDCGVYYAARLYEGEGDAALRSIWYRYTGVVPPDAPIPPFAAIVNRGRLVAQDVLGVPTVFDRFPHNTSQAMAEPTTRYDLRWVDNYGDYSSRMFRYGGEWGGVPAVFHFGAAKTLVEGGCAWYWNRSVADAMVVGDSPDGDIKVFGVAFAQYRQYLKRIELLWRDSSGVDHPLPRPQMHFTCPVPESPSAGTAARPASAPSDAGPAFPYRHVMVRDFRTVKDGKVINFNIGTAAHCPGTLAALKARWPGVKFSVWASAPLVPELARMMERRFPEVEIFVGDKVPKTDADLFLVSSGSGIAGGVRRSIAAWRAEKGAKAPVAAYAIGYGRGIKQFTETFDFCFFRDQKALKSAEKDSAAPDIHGFAPDAVFDFDAADDAGAEALLAEHGLERGKFVCAIPGNRFTPWWDFMGGKRDAAKAAKNAEREIPDNAIVCAAIIEAVRKYGVKALLCAEQRTELPLATRVLYDRLPPDVKERCVVLRRFWSPDLALGVYRRSRCVFGIEMHSQVMALGNGIPACVFRHSGFGSKSGMWCDVGADDWLLDIDTPDAARKAAAMVGAILADPAKAAAKCREVRKAIDAAEIEATAKIVKKEKGS